MHIKLGYTDGRHGSEKRFSSGNQTQSNADTLVLFVDCILNIENYLYTGLMDKKKKVAEQILI